MTIASTPRRNRAVIALWKAYHVHATAAAGSREFLASMPTMKARAEQRIEDNDRAAVECLDMLSQTGEDVGKIPRLEDIEEMEKRGE